MNRVLTCIGDYADNPLYIDKVFTNVYSAEELCYVLYENAFLLDKEILDRSLVQWVEKELHLTDLAKDLYVLINQNASAAAFVGTILSYVGYYNRDEIARVESILRMNVSMNVFEKWKAKADFLVENRHLLLAIHEYEKLLEGLPEEEVELKAGVLNNMGVTYMNLYLNDSAARCFKASYEVDNNPEAMKHYLAAMRLSLTDEEYIKLIAEEEDAYKMSITLESRIEEVGREFDISDKAARLKEVFEKKDNGAAGLYYEELGEFCESLKDEYRDIVLETQQ